MTRFLAMALFCEDIREESNGQDTLIGVLPDNIYVPKFPAMMPKLSIYTRISFRPEDAPSKAILLKARLPDGKEVPMDFPLELIQSSREQAIARKNTFVGLITRVTFNPLPLTVIGKIDVIASFDGEEVVCGSVSISNEAPPSEKAAVYRTGGTLNWTA